MGTHTENTVRGSVRPIDVLIHLPRVLRLYWRLFRDRRVPVWPKLMLGAALAYVVLPFDVVPDMLPLIGEVDDLVVLLVAARWFVEWCPPAVVREHVRALARTSPA